MTRPLLLLLLATLSGPASLSGPAAAQQPQVLPTRDVTLVYRVGGAATTLIPGGIPGAVRVAWSAAQQRLRAEPEGRTQVLLVDLGARSAKLVDSSLRAAMSLPVRDRDLQSISLVGARLTRRGSAVVAGVGCTEYGAQSSRGHGTVCLTADGVALRGAGELDGRQGSFTATAITYGPLPADLFGVPQGYFQLAMPQLAKPQLDYKR
ncbi:MAG: hypothetical protein NVSMB18_12180 [Acetobacteraceae bacterium]